MSRAAKLIREAISEGLLSSTVKTAGYQDPSLMDDDSQLLLHVAANLLTRVAMAAQVTVVTVIDGDEPVTWRLSFDDGAAETDENANDPKRASFQIDQERD